MFTLSFTSLGIPFFKRDSLFMFAKPRQLVRCVILAISSFTVAGQLSAAEIVLRPQAKPAERVVRLGDLCEITATDPQTTLTLAKIELGPAPAGTATQTLRMREIQDRLALAGVNLAEHRFSGASQVVIGEKKPTGRAPAMVNPAQRRAAETAAAEAIRKMLENPREFEISVAMTDEQAAGIPASASMIRVVSPVMPQPGKQELTVAATGRDAKQLSLVAEFKPAARVVVVTRGVTRGTPLSAADLELQIPSTKSPANAFHSLEEVIGQETALAIAQGQILDPQYLRNPVAIRRGEVVEVTVRSGGVQVHTKARAKADGGVGDVIAAELIDTKQPLVVRVSGPQAVELLGGSGRRE